MLPPKLSWTTFCHDSPWRETPWRSTDIDSRSASPRTGSRTQCTSRKGGCSSIRSSWSTRQGRLARERQKLVPETGTNDTTPKQSRIKTKMTMTSLRISLVIYCREVPTEMLISGIREINRTWTRNLEFEKKCQKKTTKEVILWSW